MLLYSDGMTTAQIRTATTEKATAAPEISCGAFMLNEEPKNSKRQKIGRAHV